MSYLNDALKGKMVLVIGSTGLIGRRLAQRLAMEEGATVTGTGRDLRYHSRISLAEGQKATEAWLRAEGYFTS